MSLPAEIDELVLQLASSLPPPHYTAFIAAAHAALAEIDCNHLGPGTAYRRLRDLQKYHYDYPPDPRAARGPNHYRPSKLVAAPALGRDDPRTGGRDRTRMRAVR
jgi:hypothetical protein